MVLETILYFSMVRRGVILSDGPLGTPSRLARLASTSNLKLGNYMCFTLV